jgi:hypothetical protein
MFKVLSFAVLTSVVLNAATPAFACDRELRSFPRDCAIQDKFRNIRSRLSRLNVDIEEVAEYRAIRFIDRGSWEKAKLKGIGPRFIYQPAPETWETFDNGIRYIDRHLEIDDLDVQTLPQVHVALISKNIVDKKTESTLSPGQFRTAGHHVNGFPLVPDCKNDPKCTNNPEVVWRLKQAKALPQDNVNTQLQWEKKTGETFSSIVARNNGPDPEHATLFAQLGILIPQRRVHYVPSEKVMNYIQWFMIYKNHSLEKLARGEAVQSPIELAADLQRMLVGIHPFGDGNGRLSRAIADLVLKKFDLPKDPSGDLVNDVLSLRNEYRANTYSAIEKMLVKLEECVKYHRFPYFQKKLRMQCATVSELRNDVGQK